MYNLATYLNLVYDSPEDFRSIGIVISTTLFGI